LKSSNDFFPDFQAVVLNHPVDPASLAEKSPVVISTYGGSQQHPDERLYLACSIA